MIITSSVIVQKKQKHLNWLPSISIEE